MPGRGRRRDAELHSARGLRSSRWLVSLLQRPPHMGMSCSCPIGACDGGSGQRGVLAGQAHVRPCWLQAVKGCTSHPGEPGRGPLTAHVAASGWALPPAWLTHAPRQGARAQWSASGSRTAGSPSDLGSGSPFLLFPCPLKALTEHGRHKRVSLPAHVHRLPHTGLFLWESAFPVHLPPSLGRH